MAGLLAQLVDAGVVEVVGDIAIARRVVGRYGRAELRIDLYVVERYVLERNAVERERALQRDLLVKRRRRRRLVEFVVTQALALDQLQLFAALLLGSSQARRSGTVLFRHLFFVSSLFCFTLSFCCCCCLLAKGNS